MNKTIDQAAREMMRQDSKVGILATLDEEGYPHMTFLSSLQGLGESGMTFGSFCEGLSKKFIKKRPDAGFLVLSPDMRWLRGNARYTHTETTGAVFDEYNNKPLFRYNCYFGFHTIYFMDLMGISKMHKLPMGKIVPAAIATRMRAPFAGKSGNHALRPVGKALFGQLDGLKFLCKTPEEGGMLRIMPIIQAAPAGTDRIVFTGGPYKEDVKAVRPGDKAAVLCLNLQMQSVLVKGTMLKTGLLEIERVYNSMPIKSRYIYPMEQRPQPVTEF